MGVVRLLQLLSLTCVCARARARTQDRHIEAVSYTHLFWFVCACQLYNLAKQAATIQTFRKLISTFCCDKIHSTFHYWFTTLLPHNCGIQLSSETSRETWYSRGNQLCLNKVLYIYIAYCVKYSPPTIKYSFSIFSVCKDLEFSCSLDLLQNLTETLRKSYCFHNINLWKKCILKIKTKNKFHRSGDGLHKRYKCLKLPTSSNKVPLL